ncbi:hypothetical protein Dimus_009526 [Dionaea muscipula]
MTEKKKIHEGLITKALSNGMFRVRLENDALVLGYISRRIRLNFIQILPGDRVQIEISDYDSTKGRIIHRLSNKKSKNKESNNEELDNKESNNEELDNKESNN